MSESRAGQAARESSTVPALSGAGQEAPRRVVRYGAQHIGAHYVGEEQAGGAVGEMLADRFEDIAALNAVDNYWPPAEKSERFGDPIGERRVRIDVIGVNDIDFVLKHYAESSPATARSRCPSGTRRFPGTSLT
jgi:hypothetical protein